MQIESIPSLYLYYVVLFVIIFGLFKKNVAWFVDSIQVQPHIKEFQLTFLNASRLHEKLPKHPNTIGCCISISPVIKTFCSIKNKRFFKPVKIVRSLVEFAVFSLGTNTNPID